MKSDTYKCCIKLNIIKPSDVVDNTWTVSRISKKRYPAGWKNLFKDAEHELKDISDILENDKKVNGRFYPDCKDLFRTFNLTPLDGNVGVKVVIIGKNPYHGCNYDGTSQDQGIAYSIKRGEKITRPLINIFKELRNTVKGFTVPNHGDLYKWSVQGVLLLNSCLTARRGDPGCHKEIWFGFIKKVINAILYTNSGCIFVIWGRYAKKIRKMLGERATVLEGSHPSSYGFSGCDHFNEINKLLINMGKIPINWNL